MVADGVKDQSFIDNAKSAAEGTIITCPCTPPNAAPEFAAAYKKAYNSDPNTYSGEGFDSAQILLDGIAAGKDRSSMVDFVKTYDKKGVTKQLKFDAKGESSEIHVYAYKVAERQDRADRRDQVAPKSTASRGGRGICSDRLLTA